MMIRPAASLVAALSCLVFVASAQFAIPAAAEGATEEVSVPATLVISTENDPANLAACGTLAFYEWSDVPNTTSATVNYTKNGAPASETAAAPFHDSLPGEKPPRYAPPGRHWISVGFSYAAGGPIPNLHCKNEYEPKMQTVFSPTATVVLTVPTVDVVPGEKPTVVVPGAKPACKSTKSTLKKRSKAVRKLNGRLGKASSQRAKSRVQRKLRKAKKQKKTAAKAVKKAC
jgi:hypothetical protein